MSYPNSTGNLPSVASGDVITAAGQDAVITAVNALTYYAVDTGLANAYVVTLSPIPSYITGLVIRFSAANANSGASTLNVNSLGVTTIKKSGSTDLSNGDIVAGQLLEVVYDGTYFQLVGGPGSAYSVAANKMFEATSFV